jgi:hypothetical protein
VQSTIDDTPRSDSRSIVELSEFVLEPVREDDEFVPYRE